MNLLHRKHQWKPVWRKHALDLDGVPTALEIRHTQRVEDQRIVEGWIADVQCEGCKVLRGLRAEFLSYTYFHGRAERYTHMLALGDFRTATARIAAYQTVTLADQKAQSDLTKALLELELAQPDVHDVFVKVNGFLSQT